MIQKIIITASILGVVFGIWWWNQGDSVSPQIPLVSQEPRIEPGQVIKRGSDRVLISKNEHGQTREKVLSLNEQSFVALARAFNDFSDAQRTPEQFAEHLRSIGLEPTLAKDQQKEIEDLTIIRTRNTLPGVRYIHAQFDGDDVQELQHMSFEVQKGEKAYQESIELLKSTMGLSKSVPDTDSRVTIFRKNGYVIWIKELTWEDMMNDPFNAYEEKDAGNIRVAIERDIHAHHGEDGHEH